MAVEQDNLRFGQVRVSSLEQASPPYWNRSLYCFKTQTDTQKEDVVRVLQKGLTATFVELPILKAQMVPMDDEEQQGKKDLVPGGNEDLFVKDLTSSALEYGQLHAKAFPISKFDDETFWATPAFPSPDDKIPVFAAQANFIKGGLLLGISFWHMVMDGPALATVLRLLAANCLRIQDPARIQEDVYKLSDSVFDKRRLHESRHISQGLPLDHPEYVLASKVPTGPPSVMMIPLKLEIFRISPAALKALKVAATPVVETETDSKEPVWVSTNDAVGALIWRSIMIATYSGTDNEDKVISSYLTAVNARPKMDPPLPADYFGCALTFGTSELPITSIQAADSLPTMALLIRQSIQKITFPYLRSVIALMRNIPDFRRFGPTAFPQILSSAAITTSWSAFPLYEYDWGPLFGGKCERVRGPKMGMFNGLQTILPALSDRLGGGYEIMIGLEPHVMERLKSDEVWRRYCEALED